MCGKRKKKRKAERGDGRGPMGEMLEKRVWCLWDPIRTRDRERERRERERVAW